MASYHHTQRSPLPWLLAPAWIIPGVLPFLMPLPQAAEWGLLSLSALMMLTAATFSTMTIEEIGGAVEIRFGPLPIVKFTIPFAEITQVSIERTTLLDGWGIHYVRGGWLYNVWGFDCVKVSLGKKVIRIGTDEPDALLACLQSQSDIRKI